MTDLEYFNRLVREHPDYEVYIDFDAEKRIWTTTVQDVSTNVLVTNEDKYMMYSVQTARYLMEDFLKGQGNG